MRLLTIHLLASFPLLGLVLGEKKSNAQEPKN
jgi:hypothetical protein